MGQWENVKNELTGVLTDGVGRRKRRELLGGS